MSIIEAANGAPRTQADEKATMAEKRLLQNLAKNYMFPPLHTHKGTENVSNSKCFP